MNKEEFRLIIKALDNPGSKLTFDYTNKGVTTERELTPDDLTNKHLSGETPDGYRHFFLHKISNLRILEKPKVYKRKSDDCFVMEFQNGDQVAFYFHKMYISPTSYQEVDQNVLTEKLKGVLNEIL